ncbi:HEAT repeat protein, partial [Trichostrongylus colubriformis]
AVQLTNEDPAQRTQLSSLLGHPALSNSLIQIIEFCNTIHLKTDDEKDEFFGVNTTTVGAFRAIVPRLRSIPADVVARRLCRLLLSRYVLLEARSQAQLYPALLVPAEDGDGILPRSHFQHRMVPEILRLFKVRESAVRTVLLSHFHLYARYIAHERLVGFVTDEVIHGCHDNDNHLVAASLRALAILVEIAGADAVCPWPISKIFANGSPL